MRNDSARRPEPRLLETPRDRRGGLSFRAIGLGTVAVAFVAAFAPYNNLVLDNTGFFASHFPIGVTLLMVIAILAVNPLLHWLRPTWALTGSELITIWAMLLVASAFPTIGLLRNWLPWMVAPFHLLTQHPEWAAGMDLLPDWLFPTTATDNDAVVTNFMLGRDADAPVNVPWSEWARTGAVWAVYYLPLFGAVLLLSVLLSRQWIVHEKLQFPIASLMLEMVQDPKPGRIVPPLFSNRSLWIGAGVVVAIQLLNGLHGYYPKVPNVPLSFNFRDLFTEGLWEHFDDNFKQGSIHFLMVGIAFLVTTEVSLTVWFFTVLYSFVLALFRYHGVDTWEALRSQNYGMCLAMGGYLLFLARSHLRRALRSAFGFDRRAPDHDYRGYRWVVWGLLGCFVTAVGWLWFMGMSVHVAIAHILILLSLYLVMARFMVETGMLYVYPGVWPEFFFPLLPGAISAKSQALVIATSGPVFFLRTSLMPYAINALRMGHEARRQASPTAAAPPPATLGTGVHSGFVATLAGSMLVSIFVAAVVAILIYYTHGAVRINTWFSSTWISLNCNEITGFMKGKPMRPGQSPVHVAIGAGIIILMGFCRQRFTWWPFVPIVLCMVPSTTGIWISVFVGWACKSATMRIGGVSAYHRVRPVFLGMIVGQVLMDGVWMAVGAIVRLVGYQA